MAVTFEHARLANGLTIIAEVDPQAHSAAAGFFVKTGARDESPELMGVSHFLEHMMFKGTESISAAELNAGFDDLGARNNAYTSGEMTVFYAQVLPERLAAGLDLLGTMMRPALRQGDFDTEKGVILEEIAMYQDNPFWVLYEEAIDRHYAPHRLGHRVLGTPETIAAMPSGAMRGYFAERYSADNTVLALAGRVDFAAAVAQAERLCGSWQTTGAHRDNTTPARNNTGFTLRDAGVNRAYAIMLASAPAVQDEERYAASVLGQILGAGDNSRLHWALIDTGLAEQAQAGYDPHDGSGDWFVYASGEPDRAEAIVEALERECDGLAGTLAEADLERVRGKLATSATLGGERPGDRMQRIGRLWTQLGRYLPLEEELERINAVSLDDLRAVLERWPLSPRTTALLLPSEAADGETGSGDDTASTTAAGAEATVG